jgi:hypothetical protein
VNYLGVTTLLVLLPFLAGMTVAGSSVKWLVSAAFARSLRPPALGFPDLAGRIVLDFALGTTVVPLFYLLSTVVGVRLTPEVAVGILALLVGVLAFRVVRRYRATVGPAIGWVRDARWQLAAVAALGLAALALRLWPYWNLYVYAGDDIRLYATITQLVTSSGQLPGSFGPFGDPSWIVTTDNHLFFSGSEALYAFAGAWLPLGAPQLVSAGTLIYGAAIPVATYLFVRSFFPQRGPWPPVIAGLAVGIVASYPLFMIQWGGIDETIAWFLVPVVFSVLLLGWEGPAWNPPWVVIEALLIGGLGLITPLGLVYLIAFLVPFLAEVALRRQVTRRAVATMCGGVALGLLVLSPAMIGAGLAALRSGSALPAGSLGWGSFATAPLFQPGDPPGDLNRLLTLATGWNFSVFVVVLGLAGLLYLLRTRWVISIVSWILTLFLLNENGPFGLYWVQYPGWGAVFPDRTAHLIFLPLSIGVGLLLAPLVDGVLHAAPNVGAAGGRSTLGRPPPGRTSRFVRTLCATVLAFALVTTGVGVYETAQANNVTVYFETALTTQDIAGLQWLKANAPSGTTVLVDEADAGTWVPGFTGLRAFPFIEVINNASTLEVYANLTSQLQRANFTMLAYLAATYDIGYVYFGQRWAGGLSNPLTPLQFETKPPAWSFVSQAQLCRPPLTYQSVNMYCANDSATFLGPVALEIGIGGGMFPTENLTVAVPEGTSYTYTVSPPPNGAPVPPVHISVLAPGKSVFADDNVEILQINPAYRLIVHTQPPLNAST